MEAPRGGPINLLAAVVALRFQSLSTSLTLRHLLPLLPQAVRSVLTLLTPNSLAEAVAAPRAFTFLRPPLFFLQ